MCYYPKIIKNPRYSQYKIKKGDIKCDDYRKLYIPVGCGHCYECKRQKSQQWRVRMLEEMKTQKHAYFITLTFSNESLTDLCKESNTWESNAIATIAVRRFLERYRKKYKKSLRHWLITELGHENTERIHLHGVIFPPNEMNNDELTKLWKYGRTDIGEYCNERTINYIVKYVTKIDKDHKGYEPIILCSAGIGETYVRTLGAQMKYRYEKGKSPEDYTLPNGRKVALPIYYRNKLYNSHERENLWTDRLDKGIIYVGGIKIRNIESTESTNYYYRLLQEFQEWNKKIGYGDNTEEWQKIPYNITFKMLQRAKKQIGS